MSNSKSGRWRDRVQGKISTWLGEAPSRAADCVFRVCDSYFKDAARWTDYERFRRYDRVVGIFGGPDTLGVFDPDDPQGSASYNEYADERRVLTSDGLSVQFTCSCGQPRMLQVGWLELAAVAAGMSPSVLPERLRAAWQLEAPTAWRHSRMGGWSPDGFPCPRCLQQNGPYEFLRYGERYAADGKILPGIFPAEARSVLPEAINRGVLPHWFFPALTVFLALRVGAKASGVYEGAACRLASLLRRSHAAAEQTERTAPRPYVPKGIEHDFKRSDRPWGLQLTRRAYGRPGEVKVTYHLRDASRFKTMWTVAGCYELLRDGDGRDAKKLLEMLQVASASMVGNPERYRQLEHYQDASYEEAVTVLFELVGTCGSWLNMKLEVETLPP